MTQSSVAISADGNTWAVLNASPDIRAQFARARILRPKALRHSPVDSVVLTNGDIDHIAGLLTLREKSAFTVYGSGEVLQILQGNSVFKVLDPDFVTQQPITVEEPFCPVPGVAVTAFSVPGKVALFLEGEQVALAEVGERTLGLMLETTRGRVAYVPGCAALPDWLIEMLDSVDLLLFDGTVWENDDMLRTGTGEKTGARMGHIPMTGPGGSLDRLNDISARKIYIHINNTNPVLQPDSPERRTLAQRGWELAYDEMEIAL